MLPRMEMLVAVLLCVWPERHCSKRIKGNWKSIVVCEGRVEYLLLQEVQAKTRL
jgi:hypothetical protein